MGMSLKYHVITSLVFVFTPGFKVTHSPPFTDLLLVLSRSAAETPETHTNTCLRTFLRKKLRNKNYVEIRVHIRECLIE